MRSIIPYISLFSSSAVSAFVTSPRTLTSSPALEKETPFGPAVPFLPSKWEMSMADMMVDTEENVKEASKMDESFTISIKLLLIPCITLFASYILSKEQTEILQGSLC